MPDISGVDGMLLLLAPQLVPVPLSVWPVNTSTHLSSNLRNTPIDYIDSVDLDYRALHIHEKKYILCLCLCFGPGRTRNTYSLSHQ